jgi:glycosyltransferase involved in cell wall biosynthesis
LLRLSEKISLRWADKIIFVSEYRMNLQPEKIKKKSVWIPNGVGNFTATTSTDYIDTIGLGGCRYILSVGRITPEKGFLDLVRAFNKMNDKTGVKLVIAGGVEYETCYMSRLKAESGDDVIYTGEVSFENLEQLYSHTSLLVISSYNEEAPLVPLEAMSCNAQLLMSNLPATRCFGLPDNCYFKAGNVDELSSMMTYRLSAEPIKCTLDLQRYKWCNIADKVFEVYKSVTNAI